MCVCVLLLRLLVGRAANERVVVFTMFGVDFLRGFMHYLVEVCCVLFLGLLFVRIGCGVCFDFLLCVVYDSADFCCMDFHAYVFFCVLIWVYWHICCLVL